MRACFLITLLVAVAHAAVPPTHPAELPTRLGSPTVRENGYTLDTCNDDDDCKGKRQCIVQACLPDSEEDITCSKCSDCDGYADKHEVCATDTDKVERCMSITHAQELGLEVASDCEGVSSGTGSSTPVEPVGLPTKPLPAVSNPENAKGTPGPTRAPITTVTTTRPIIPGGGEPPAEADADSDSEESSSVCVAVHHLGHLAAHELVFASHVHARVLCDANDSCATPGHMVVFRQRPMMMRSYCEVTHGGCTERRAMVNSPRFKRQMAVASKTEGLHFTALAARFVTKVEEHALKVAIRAGL